MTDFIYKKVIHLYNITVLKALMLGEPIDCSRVDLYNEKCGYENLYNDIYNIFRNKKYAFMRALTHFNYYCIKSYTEEYENIHLKKGK